MRTAWSGIVAVALIAASSGCARQDRRQPAPAAPAATTVPQAADSIRIVSSSPSGNPPLRIGQKVVFGLEVEYTLSSAESATVGLVLQRAEGEQRVLASETRAVHKGKGRELLTKEIEVPDTKAITAFTPLIPQGASGSNVVAGRTFAVAKP